MVTAASRGPRLQSASDIGSSGTSVGVGDCGGRVLVGAGGVLVGPSGIAVGGAACAGVADGAAVEVPQPASGKAATSKAARSQTASM